MAATPLTRLHDWQERLAALVTQRLHTPFAWGTHDCVLFAADAVHAITGTDPAAAQRGTYATALCAARVIAAHGSLAGIAAAALGAEVLPLQACAGDVGLVHQAAGGSDRECLAVCTGACWHVPGAAGLVALPLTAAARAWRVG
jgi:hypothetical protein